MPTHLAESLATHISLLTTQTQVLAGRGGQDTLLSHLSLFALHNQQLTQLTIQQKESLEESLHKIQELEREKQTQATVIGELQILSETSKREIEALKQTMNDDVEQQVAELRKQRDQDRASLRTLLQHTGMLPLEFTMTSFEEMKKSNGSWYGPAFYTHPQGYKMCLKVYANGLGRGEGTHISVYAYLMRGEFDDLLKWPFRGSVVFQLCNQLEDKYHFGYTINFSKTTDLKYISRVTSGERAESAWGTYTLIAHNDLNFNPVKNSQYLKDDCFHFRIITVESLSEPGILPTEMTMTNFEQHKIDSDQWYSPPFYTHPQGYKMCLRVDANGYSRGKGTHVSVFARLMRGEFDDHLKWPFQGHVTVAMLNQLEDNHHNTYSIRFTNTTDDEIVGKVTDREKVPDGWGRPTFMAHSDLNYKPAKNCQYLKYDCLHFQIVNFELK